MGQGLKIQALMSSPAHGEATDGQTEKLTAAIGQACCTHTHTHTHPRAQRLWPAQVPGRAPNFQLSSEHVPESSILQIHTMEQYCLKEIPSQATEALIQHPSGNLEHLQAGGSSLLSIRWVTWHEEPLLKCQGPHP